MLAVRRLSACHPGESGIQGSARSDFAGVAVLDPDVRRGDGPADGYLLSRWIVELRKGQ